MIDAEAGAKCKNNERALEWNQRGPKGDTGPGAAGAGGARRSQGRHWAPRASWSGRSGRSSGPAGPTGSAGADGKDGVDGVNGVSGYELAQGSASTRSGATLEKDVACPAGKVAISGGFRAAGFREFAESDRSRSR